MNVSKAHVVYPCSSFDLDSNSRQEIKRNESRPAAIILAKFIQLELSWNEAIQAVKGLFFHQQRKDLIATIKAKWPVIVPYLSPVHLPMVLEPSVRMTVRIRSPRKRCQNVQALDAASCSWSDRQEEAVHASPVVAVRETPCVVSPEVVSCSSVILHTSTQQAGGELFADVEEICLEAEFDDASVVIAWEMVPAL